MLKTLFILMLPLLIFGQEVSYQDTVVTISTKEYLGRIVGLEENSVEIDLGDGVIAAIEIANVAKMIFENTGEVYNSDKGFKKDYRYYKKYVLSARNKNTDIGKSTHKKNMKCSCSADNESQSGSSAHFMWKDMADYRRALVAGQTDSFMDTVVTKSNIEYLGRIVDLEANNVKIDLGDGVVLTINIAIVLKIAFDGYGEVYSAEKGCREDYLYYEKYILSVRNEIIIQKEKEREERAQKDSTQNAEYYRPGDHEVLLMPTAYTMEKGQSCLTDYELVFLKYTYAVTSSTHISATVAFYMMEKFYKTLTIGIKQNYFESEHIAGAVFAYYFNMYKGYAFGNTISIGNRYSAFHFAIGGVGIDDVDHIEPLIMLGGIINLSDMTSILLEYDNGNSMWKDNSLNGYMSIGIRFRNEKASFEIGAIRELAKSSSNFPLIPWLKGTLVFGKRK